MTTSHLDSRDFIRALQLSEHISLKINTPGDVMQEIRTLLEKGFSPEVR